MFVVGVVLLEVVTIVQEGKEFRDANGPEYSWPQIHTNYLGAPYLQSEFGLHPPPSELRKRMAWEEDPFDKILGLEDDFYKEGFDLGVKDGKRAGLIDGRFFGLENGFEKYVAMGRLHGRASIWAGRLQDAHDRTQKAAEKRCESASAKPHESIALSDHPRLEPHLRALYALTEPDSLSTENTENSVADFDDRLKRAEGKVKIIEKLTGELNQDNRADRAGEGLRAKGDGGIEDTSILSIRH